MGNYRMRDPGCPDRKGWEESSHPRDDHGRFSSGAERAATREHFESHLSPTGKLERQILPKGSHHYDQGMPSEQTARDARALHDHLAEHIAKDPKWREGLTKGVAAEGLGSGNIQPRGWKQVLGSAQNLQSLAALHDSTRIPNDGGIVRTLMNQARTIAGLPTHH